MNYKLLNVLKIVQKNCIIFRFFLKDGTIIEIEGFWDNRSKLNVSQFMEQYPSEKYLVIDADSCRCIANKYKNIIKNWENSEVGATNDTVQIVGITISQRMPYVSKLVIGDKLQLVREPNNEYDPRAIRVNDLKDIKLVIFQRIVILFMHKK